jgi:hypothetical protein
VTPLFASRSAKEKRISHVQRFFQEDFRAGLQFWHTEIEDRRGQNLDAML